MRITRKTFVLFIGLLSLASGGCISAPGYVRNQDDWPWSTSAAEPTAYIRTQVFDTPRDVVDQLVPMEKRSPIAGSDYFVSIDQCASASKLAQAGTNCDSGILADDAQDIRGWPNSSARTYVKPLGPIPKAGTGGALALISGAVDGDIGVRNSAGIREIRIDVTVDNESNPPMNDHQGDPSRIFYSGPVPPCALVFAAPFERGDGTKRYHVVLFWIGTNSVVRLQP